jgi:uncharacterized delta-60 repeat protein
MKCFLYLQSRFATATIKRCLATLAISAFTCLNAPVTAQAPGSLDTTFAGSGRIQLSFGSGKFVDTALALQPDGKIVMAGVCSNGSNDDFCVARLNSDGSLDASFDGPSGAANGKFLLPISDSGNDRARAIALQPDGKIVIGGDCQPNITAQGFCLARLNLDGSLDVSFTGPSGTGNGKFLLAIGAGTDRFTALALQPDGKIIVGGSCDNGDYTDVCLARFTPDGSFDASFSGPNAAGSGKFLMPIGSRADQLLSIVLQPDGKIIIAGGCMVGGLLDFCLARFNPNGSLDVSFGEAWGQTAGTLLVPRTSESEVIFAVALQPDGKILVAGECYGNGRNNMCLARLHANGDLDTRFVGPNGTGNGRFQLPIGASAASAYRLALQPDGKILVAGYCAENNDFDFCVARLNLDGSFDASFDGSNGAGNGKVVLPLATIRDYLSAIVLQPDGKIVVGGYCGGNFSFDFCAARLNGGPYGARNCTLDIDGDGLVTATTDMLIHTRVALGLRGATVIGGINFPANSTRNTWPQIRDYLVSQCGMSVY